MKLNHIDYDMEDIGMILLEMNKWITGSGNKDKIISITITRYGKGYLGTIDYLE